MYRNMNLAQDPKNTIKTLSSNVHHSLNFRRVDMGKPANLYTNKKPGYHRRNVELLTESLG